MRSTLQRADLNKMMTISSEGLLQDTQGLLSVKYLFAEKQILPKIFYY